MTPTREQTLGRTNFIQNGKQAIAYIPKGSCDDENYQYKIVSITLKKGREKNAVRYIQIQYLEQLWAPSYDRIFSNYGLLSKIGSLADMGC